VDKTFTHTDICRSRWPVKKSGAAPCLSKPTAAGNNRRGMGNLLSMAMNEYRSGGRGCSITRRRRETQCPPRKLPNGIGLEDEIERISILSPRLGHGAKRPMISSS